MPSAWGSSLDLPVPNHSQRDCCYSMLLGCKVMIAQHFAFLRLLEKALGFSLAFATGENINGVAPSHSLQRSGGPTNK